MERCKPIPVLTESQRSNFWALVDKGGPDDHWLWLGGTTQGIRGGDPYGIWAVVVDGKQHNLRPPRVAFTELTGPIPEGLTIDHVKERCTHTLCVNPAHLEPVTQSVNSMRRSGATETMCANGHPRINAERCATCRAATLKKYNDKTKDQRAAYYRAKGKKARKSTITENPIAAFII